ncbi:MAG: restriction endonuclease subunit S, partial [Leptospira sp.]|nr:restriction endonuclease subunit S [Leptospira sp.]
MSRFTECKLGELVQITGGGTPSRIISEYWDGDIPWVTVKDFTSKNIVTAQEKITEIGLKNSASNLIPAHSILMPTRMALGKIAINSIPVAINQDIKALNILDKDRLNSKYLVSYLSTISNEIENAGKGATVKGIKLDFLKDLSIPLPPLPEQVAIANLLSKADALIAKRKESLALLDAYLKSTFLEMFGDPVRNEKGWEVKRLGDVVHLRAGQFVSASEIQSNFTQGLYSCYGGNGRRGYVKTFTHDGEFVLIGRQGALCGNVKVAKGQFHATEHAVVCSPKIFFETSWLYYLLEIINLNKYASGAAQPGLTVGKLEQIDIIFAPLELQNQFAAVVEKVEALKEKYHKSLGELENLYGSLSQR